MSARGYERPFHAASESVIKPLAGLRSYGHRPSDIFDDWLTVVETSLTRAPDHLRAIRDTGRPAEETEADAAEWERLRRRYENAPEAFSRFAEAFAALQRAAAESEYRDFVGDVYMSFGWPHTGLGQFFTPEAVARMMASMQIPDGEAEVHQRIREAAEKDTYAQVILLAGAMCREPEQSAEWFHCRLLPSVAPHVDPITVSDPTCGSGVMILAAATRFPRWANDWALVRYYGQDVDPSCCRMARINCMLYGLNGYALRLRVAAAGVERPEPAPVAKTAEWVQAPLFQAS